MKVEVKRRNPKSAKSGIQVKGVIEEQGCSGRGRGESRSALQNGDWQWRIVI